MTVAVGPFTTAADREQEPLHELLQALQDLDPPPAALLLAGPFLDEGHPDVASGHLTTSFQQAFDSEVGCRAVASLIDWLRDTASHFRHKLPECSIEHEQYHHIWKQM